MVLIEVSRIGGWLKLSEKENRAIQKIICLKCRNDLEHIRDLPDKYNSDFYEIQYKCPNCNYSIEIITHEWRDWNYEKIKL